MSLRTWLENRSVKELLRHHETLKHLEYTTPVQLALKRSLQTELTTRANRLCDFMVNIQTESEKTK